MLPAYNAAATLERTVREIPPGVADSLILVDDASTDATVDIARSLGIRTVVHGSNRGYGGNQKSCYRLALESGADVVVMLHPDYQYDPELIPALVAPLAAGTHDVMLGSRVLDGGARAGGMPTWKYLGNRVLTRVQNLLLGLRLSEFHTGYRAYTAEALRAVPFDRNAEGFRFDAQMLTQLAHHGMRIGEVASPARYRADSSSVGLTGSVRYGMGCITAALRYRLHRAGLAPAGWLGRRDDVRMRREPRPPG